MRWKIDAPNTMVPMTPTARMASANAGLPIAKPMIRDSGTQAAMAATSIASNSLDEQPLKIGGSMSTRSASTSLSCMALPLALGSDDPGGLAEQVRVEDQDPAGDDRQQPHFVPLGAAVARFVELRDGRPGGPHECRYGDCQSHH